MYSALWPNLPIYDTTQSCEGHLEHGLAAPWIEAQAPETPAIRTLRTQLDQLTNTITLEDERRPDEELKPLYQESRRLFGEIRRPQLIELQKVADLLTEFYHRRQQMTYERLLTIHGNRVESQGAPFQEIIPSEERRQKLIEYQEEVKLFTTFLKDKYIAT